MLFKQRRKKITILLLFLFLNLSLFYINTPTVDALANTKLAITPATQTVNTSDTFSIYVTCTPTRPIKGFELEISFNPTLLKAVTVTEGDFFEPYFTFFNDGDIDNTHGKITNIFGLIVGPGNVTSPGSFVKITFTAKTKTGTAAISFSSVGEWTGVTDEYGYLPISVTNGNVKIIGESGSSGSSSNPGGGGGGGIIIPMNPVDNTQENQNTPPVISNNLSGPTHVIIGVEYNYTIKAYDNEDNNITIIFDSDNGNETIKFENVISNTTLTFTQIYRTATNHTLKAIAQDGNGLNSTWSNTLFINVFSKEDTNNSIDPEVNVSYSEKATQNQTIIFNASESQNNSINITNYSWDFGDNNTETGNPVKHTYKEPDTYYVILIMTDSNNNTYIKKMIVTITRSDIPVIKEGETTEEKNNNNVLIGFLIIISITLPIMAYIFIFEKKAKNYIIDFTKKIIKFIFIYTKKAIVIIFSSTKKTKVIIFKYMGKIKIFISNNMKKNKKQITSEKKIGALNFFTRRSIENIDKKIEKISSNIHSNNKPSFITDPKPTSCYDYNLRDINMLEDDSNNNGKILENFFKYKSKNFRNSDTIGKLYKKLFKTDNVNLDESEISKIDLTIDKFYDKSVDKLFFNKELKNNIFNDISIDNIDNIVDEILKSRKK